ncbi:hypothetical protein [Streptomyces sp. NPDC060035]|uniref:hypothetical protein n=1 Tax=Streptomyces sp. NPDC060035 TaxID=3347044 RepID=UPI0036845381
MVTPATSSSSGRAGLQDGDQLSDDPAWGRWLGIRVIITVAPADTTDRDAARELLWRLRVMQPQITRVRADCACTGRQPPGSWPHR